MAPTPKHTVRVGGVTLQSVDNLKLRFSMTEIADSFSLTVNDKVTIDDGAPVEISVLGRLVLVGEVMNWRLDKSAGARSISISGFSSAQRLTKSSVLRASRTIAGKSLADIVRTIVEPFGLAVGVSASAAEVANELLDRVRVDNGETAWSFLSEVCQRQGCLLVSGASTVVPGEPARAAVLITRVSTTAAPVIIVSPSPRVLSIGFESDTRDINSQIIVTPRGGGVLDSDGSVEGRTGEAFDERVPYSPVIVQSRKGGRSEAALKRQAEWELRKRSAEGQRVSAVVDGWSPNDSQALWWPNTVYRLVDTEEAFDSKLLVASVELSVQVGGQGARATLELIPPDAYAILEDNRIKPKPKLTADPAWLAQNSGLIAASLLAGGFIGGQDAAVAAAQALVYKPEDPDA